MSTRKNAWEAEDWDELQMLVELDEVRKALKNREDQRLYHKSAYLKRSAKMSAIRQLASTDPDLAARLKELGF